MFFINAHNITTLKIIEIYYTLVIPIFGKNLI
jgi:hypothetical protein